LGENGTGKSTILQMIATAILGAYYLPLVASDVDWERFVRWPASIGNIHLKAHLFNSSTSACKKLVELGNPAFGKLVAHPWECVSITAYDFMEFGCGYSPWRRLTRRNETDPNVVPTLDDGAIGFRFATLFGDAGALTPVPTWLAGLYVRSIFPNHTPEDERRFTIAEKALGTVISASNSLLVTADQRVFVEEHGRKIPIERLSDGYRGTLAWVGDLIRRLFDAYPDSDNPLHERGVVLVDEIDLHLHPQWQRSIVGDIRKLFPNLQFIVTTHSPFIAQGLQPKDKIIVLERHAKTGVVTAREDAGALESWSADQIYSAYFGLSNGTRGDKTLKKEARYERLLDAEAAGTLTDKTRDELRKLETKIDKIPVGETQGEEAVYRMAQTMADKLRRRREELERQQSEAMHNDVEVAAE